MYDEIMMYRVIFQQCVGHFLSYSKCVYGVFRVNLSVAGSRLVFDRVSPMCEVNCFPVLLIQMPVSVYMTLPWLH